MTVAKAPGGSTSASPPSEITRALLAQRGWRVLKDRLFGWTMAVGGLAVIGALLTLFLFLLWVIFPLFRPASLAPLKAAAQAEPALHRSLNEYGDLAFVVTDDGRYRFVDALTGAERDGGSVLAQDRGTLLPGLTGYRNHGVLALGLTDGRALLVAPIYRSTFINNIPGVAASLSYPVGREPIQVLPVGTKLRALAAATTADSTTIVAVSDNDELTMAYLAPAAGLALDPDNAPLETTLTALGRVAGPVTQVLVDTDQQELYTVTASGEVSFFDIRDKAAPRLVENTRVVPAGVTVTDVRWLAGGNSLLVGDSRGRVAQWFPARDQTNARHLTKVREFTALSAPISRIEPEYFRKGFVASDLTGQVALYHTTAERTLVVAATGLGELASLAISPRADVLMATDAQGQTRRWRVSNRHPEVSWHSLWQKVWYEGRQQPEYIWQSSSASSDFEPKFSLTPLVFGTLKAAFYSLLFAIPIAVMGAIYTAYFMHATLRAFVKPSIEIMAALPTVILGFLAGLWLAPIIESHLLAVLSLTILLPLSVLLASLLWSLCPLRLRALLRPGHEVLLLVPLICVVLALAMGASQPLEELWFGGSLPHWLTQKFGFTYEQRNSLVVGIAMGFAVIPTIFSISEDAIFAVPGALTTGSLALGATPWQTLSRVVVLTASPGIFAAVLIGLGRAVGETMIVLMSTGNTPVMDFSIFQGFRALSANIAVEMPEAEVNSTHFRVLFLAAFVLFLTTFVFNSVAEVVRQRLRRRYGNL